MIANWSDEWGIARRGPYGRYVRHALNYGTSDHGVFAAKLHWYQLAWFVDKLRELPSGGRLELDDGELIASWIPNPRYIHLSRRDRAQQAISHFRAGRTGVWFVRTDEPAGERPVQPVVDESPPSAAEWQHIRWLEDHLGGHDDNWRAFFAAHRIVPLEVEYEDFVADFQGTLAAVIEFVGAGSVRVATTVQPRLARQADDLSQEWLAHYLKVRDRIAPKQARPLAAQPARTSAPQDQSAAVVGSPRVRQAR